MPYGKWEVKRPYALLQRLDVAAGLPQMPSGKTIRRIVRSVIRPHDGIARSLMANVLLIGLMYHNPRAKAMGGPVVDHESRDAGVELLGHPIRNLAARYRMYDLSACVAHVDCLLAGS